MNIDGVAYRSIWQDEDSGAVFIIDQTALPHDLVIRELVDVETTSEAISTMRVRGAPLIGATAAHGVALAMARDASDSNLDAVCSMLLGTRPTAVNLRWALDAMRATVAETPYGRRAVVARRRAAEICDDDVATNRAIGEHGLELLRRVQKMKGNSVNVLTHCNAGWLATVDWGTALAPIYAAHDRGIAVHVWVDETRPRNQGSSLTAWELMRHGVPHTVIVDNAGGHLMQHGEVDLCIVGTDRTTSIGDVCNKIGTYLKALAADDNGVPFYVAVPGSSIDWELKDGVSNIPIEQRDPIEVHEVKSGDQRVRITPEGACAKNYGFDVTPARLVTGLITEKGVCAAAEQDLRRLYRRS